MNSCFNSFSHLIKQALDVYFLFIKIRLYGSLCIFNNLKVTWIKMKHLTGLILPCSSSHIRSAFYLHWTRYFLAQFLYPGALQRSNFRKCYVMNRVNCSKNLWRQLHKQTSSGVLSKGFSQKFSKIHRQANTCARVTFWIKLQPWGRQLY